MSQLTKLDLETMGGHNLYLDKDYLRPYEDELLSQLDGEGYMQTIGFAKSVMMSQELNANNLIEGIKNDISIIDEVIRRKKSNLSESQKRRIINLYHGYRYILTHKRINEDSLRKLYSLLSEDLLEASDIKRMGDYYREAPVYILKGSHISDDYFMGAPHEKVPYFMQQYFDFANNLEMETNDIDIFLKSQIMHFYFVYIHPYFDVNGRTSRTVAMWYLLNKEAYPYIIFNRAISYARQEYEENIIKGRTHGNITLFLKYMLTSVERELEKEYLVWNIEENANITLTKEETQLLEYFVTMKGNLTAKDLMAFYCNYNGPTKPLQLLEEKIMPLIEKGILVNGGSTKSFIARDTPNIILGINKKNLDVNPQKVKHLNLERYIK